MIFDKLINENIANQYVVNEYKVVITFAILNLAACACIYKPLFCVDVFGQFDKNSKWLSVCSTHKS